jgi:hypothetical protein
MQSACETARENWLNTQRLRLWRGGRKHGARDGHTRNWLKLKNGVKISVRVCLQVTARPSSPCLADATGIERQPLDSPRRANE